MDPLTTPLAFVFGLALLIGVHEYGHFRVALWCGVRVLRFSIGMGPVVWRWRSPRSGVEYALSAIPLGGYVRMLDGRDAEVSPAERPHAFDTQPVIKRALIVVAGPLANFLLAWMLYTGAHWWGVPQSAPILAAPLAQSPAERAGLQSMDEVKAIGLQGEWQEVVSYEDLQWRLTRLATQAGAHEVRLQIQRGTKDLEVLLQVESPAEGAAAPVLRAWGFAGPWTDATITRLTPGGAAERAGLRAGDEVLRVDGQVVSDGPQLRRWIAESGRTGQPSAQTWELRRQGRVESVQVQPNVEQHDGNPIGRVGAYIGRPPALAEQNLGLLQASWIGAEKVWEVSTLSLSMLGKMLVGEASLSNLSGPLTIADYAGRSAQAGWVPYVLFLGLISVSLGVLNLLPLPMLDGGHLMVYIYEAMAGRPLSDRWQEWLQRFGILVLATGMFIALYNDLARLLG